MRRVLTLLAAVLLFSGCEDNLKKGNEAYKKEDFLTAK
jgi:PBP1b-binding outer membrane lipoprotein LpoB